MRSVEQDRTKDKGASLRELRLGLVAVLLPVSLVLASAYGCDEKGQPLGEVGDRCTEALDCVEGLLCINGTCVPPRTGDWDDSVRYSGETWTDSTLTWQSWPPEGEMSWGDANYYCANLGDGWRLPRLDELRALVRGCHETENGGACNLTEGDCLSLECTRRECAGCERHGGPNNSCYRPAEIKGACDEHWATASVEDRPELAWCVSFVNAEVKERHKTRKAQVRCVR